MPALSRPGVKRILQLTLGTLFGITLCQLLDGCDRAQEEHVSGVMDETQVRSWIERARKLHSRVTEYLELKEGNRLDLFDMSESTRKALSPDGRGLHLGTRAQSFERLLSSFARYPDSVYVCFRLSAWAQSLGPFEIAKYREVMKSEGHELSDEEYREIALEAGRVAFEIFGHTNNVLVAADRREGRRVRFDGGIE